MWSPISARCCDCRCQYEDLENLEYKHGHTPFISGIKEAGSVDMEASSRNTTGKSITFKAIHAEDRHVVHI